MGNSENSQESDYEHVQTLSETHSSSHSSSHGSSEEDECSPKKVRCDNSPDDHVTGHHVNGPSGCKKCGGGGNFNQPMTDENRACPNGKGKPCKLFTTETKFACGYKCGWKGPFFWDFAANGLQWGAHLGGGGARGCRGVVAG